MVLRQSLKVAAHETVMPVTTHSQLRAYIYQDAVRGPRELE
jgi:hypothetical protein